VSDEHPELAGYEPHAQKPLRSPKLVWGIRLVVVLAVLALVLPGVLTTVSVGSSNAERACAARVALAYPFAGGSEARFELFGPGVLGWECYLVDPATGDVHVDSMGLIPVAPRQTGVPTQDS
jgi:hypothetical protein